MKTYVVGQEDQKILQAAEAEYPADMQKHRDLAAKLQQQSRERTMLSISAVSATIDTVLSFFGVNPLLKAAAIAGAGAATTWIAGGVTTDRLNLESPISNQLPNQSYFSPFPSLDSKGVNDSNEKATLGRAGTIINNDAVASVKNTGFTMSLASAAANYGASAFEVGMGPSGLITALPGIIGLATERLCQERGRHVGGSDNAVEGRIKQPLTHKSRRRINAGVSPTARF